MTMYAAVWQSIKLEDVHDARMLRTMLAAQASLKRSHLEFEENPHAAL